MGDANSRRRQTENWHDHYPSALHPRDSEEAVPGTWTGLLSRFYGRKARGFKLFLPAIHQITGLPLEVEHGRCQRLPFAVSSFIHQLAVRIFCPVFVGDQESILPSLPTSGIAACRQPNLVAVVRLHNMALRGPSQFDSSHCSLRVFHQPSQHASPGHIDEPQQHMRGQKPDRPDHPSSGSVTGEAQPQNHRTDRQIGRLAD